MTVPSYTEDLTDLTLAEEDPANTSWYEMTGTIGGEAYNANGGPVGGDPDYPYIQGTYSVTQDCTKDTSVGSLAYNNGGGTGGHGTDGAYFVWQQFLISSNVGTYAQGGFQIVVGSGLGDFDAWYVGGKDKAPYPYGGWVNNVVNTTVSPDGTAGSPTATEQYIGSAVYVVQGSSKGEIHNCDAIRYGRGSAIFEYGEAADYADMAGFAAENDDSSKRWGLIQATSGGYLWKGRMSLGTASNAVDFRDSDVTIFLQWTPKVTANFNTIEVINASSNIEMTNFQFIVLDTSTASKGRWITTNDADVTLTTCSFQDMGEFDFDSNTTALSCTWTRCDQIDPQQADLSFSNVLAPTVTGGGADGGGALLWDVAADPNTYLNDMTFSKGAGSHHAIEFGTSAPQTINLTNMTFTDFSASNQQTTSALYFQDTGSDVTWTVAHTGTTGTISYYKERSGDTVNISSSVALSIKVQNESKVVIQNAQTSIFLLDSPYTQLMNEDTLATGFAEENYGGSTPVDIVYKVRKSEDTDDPRYYAFSNTGQVTSDGFSAIVTLKVNPTI